MTGRPESSIHVEFVAAWIVRPLRARVLRPGQPLTSVDHDYDHRADTFHVAAFGPAGGVVACATFYPEPAPDGRDAWRLRAMASAPEVRGQGYGTRALAFGLAEVRARGGTLMWCNARTPAVGFYERLGFSTVGEEFDLPPIGPHYLMAIQLTEVES